MEVVPGFTCRTILNAVEPVDHPLLDPDGVKLEHQTVE
jgi:hypothetical protein